MSEIVPALPTAEASRSSIRNDIAKSFERAGFGGIDNRFVDNATRAYIECATSLINQELSEELSSEQQAEFQRLLPQDESDDYSAADDFLRQLVPDFQDRVRNVWRRQMVEFEAGVKRTSWLLQFMLEG